MDNLTIRDWRVSRLDKVCPACLSAMREEINVETSAGKMKTWECTGCGRREMNVERAGEGVKEYGV